MTYAARGAHMESRIYPGSAANKLRVAVLYAGPGNENEAAVARREG